MPWTFRDLLDERGGNIIRLWLDDQPLKVRLRFDAILRNLRIQSTLHSRALKKIKGHENVFEIVIESFNVQYRPLGGYGPGAREFTFVMGAIEQNDRIQPPDAFDTAERRLMDVNKRVARVCEHAYEKTIPPTT